MGKGGAGQEAVKSIRGCSVPVRCLPRQGQPRGRSLSVLCLGYLPDRSVARAGATLPGPCPSPVEKHRAVGQHHQGMCIRMSCCSQCWRQPLRAACLPCSEPCAWGCPCPTPQAEAPGRPGGPRPTLQCKCLYPWPSGTGDVRGCSAHHPGERRREKPFLESCPQDADAQG